MQLTHSFLVESHVRLEEPVIALELRLGAHLLAVESSRLPRIVLVHAVLTIDAVRGAGVPAADLRRLDRDVAVRDELLGERGGLRSEVLLLDLVQVLEERALGNVVRLHVVVLAREGVAVDRDGFELASQRQRGAAGRTWAAASLRSCTRIWSTARACSTSSRA